MRIAETRLARGSVLLGAAIIAGSGAAYAQAPEVYLGDIYVTAEPFCPSTALEPMGQTLPISGFEALFAILGTEYGGDGTRTSDCQTCATNRLARGCGTASSSVVHFQTCSRHSC